MSTDVVQAVAHYAEEVMGSEGFRYVSAVVANCKMLALELEVQEEEVSGEVQEEEEVSGEVQEEGEAQKEEEEQTPEIDQDALVIAAYLHDISTVAHGFQDHQIKSAEMAEEFLRELDVPDEQVQKVKQTILTHTITGSTEQDGDDDVDRVLEGRILYDADKLGRLSGLAVATSLIEFGARYPNRAVTSEVLAAILRHIEERFIELYQSLNTAPARTMAREKFSNTLAFLDGVIEHLNDATPV